ncbi:hypothetical protein Tco_1097598 [Tanacetum coccineum]
MPSNKRPMKMLCDNEPALAITNDPGILKGARHFQRKYHYIREVIQEREIVLKKVHTNDNVAGPFTKPMPLNKHYEHAMGLELQHFEVQMLSQPAGRGDSWIHHQLDPSVGFGGSVGGARTTFVIL